MFNGFSLYHIVFQKNSNSHFFQKYVFSRLTFFESIMAKIHFSKKIFSDIDRFIYQNALGKKDFPANRGISEFFPDSFLNLNSLQVHIKKIKKLIS